MFLQALGKYLDYKAELGQLDDMYAYARAALLHYARWMVDHEYPYLEKPEILEYPTETWAAQDMRKSEIFWYARLHSEDEGERARFQERARYFFNYSIRTLERCRPNIYAGRSYCSYRMGIVKRGLNVIWKRAPLNRRLSLDRSGNRSRLSRRRGEPFDASKGLCSWAGHSQCSVWRLDSRRSYAGFCKLNPILPRETSQLIPPDRFPKASPDYFFGTKVPTQHFLES
jgi:hypothetical protein